MTFSFAINLSTDLALVRFHIGDTSNEGHYLEDETINALITSEGSVGGAVIACIKYIITQLSSPNYKLDWMSVTNEQAREGFEKLLKDKANEFGISTGVSATSTVKHAYRADSDQYTSSTRTNPTVDNTSVYDGTP